MNCELAREHIVTGAYGELPDELTHDLARHIADCEACHSEREQLLAFKAMADAHRVLEPSANLIARARLRLDESLDALPPKHWYQKLGERLLGNFASLQTAGVAAILLVAVCLGAGVFGGYEYAQNRGLHRASEPAVVSASGGLQSETALPPLAEVASISGIARQPNSEMIDVTYNQLVPRHVQGTLDDPQIRQLLMMASQNNAMPAVQDDSVSLLAAECRAGHSCQPTGIREALMVALRYDRSPKVRGKALEGLEPYVADDTRVRDAVLEAVLNDNDPGIRSAAISLLEPVEADTSVRQVLYSVSNSDESPQIRTVSRQVLSRVPEIQ